MRDLHEPRECLGAPTLEMHRALLSLIEELEAIDWYAQRIEASQDAALKRVLAHSLEEEKEHAAMTLEWIRQNDAGFAQSLSRFLFKDSAKSDDSANDSRAGTLAIGSLREARS